MTEPAGPTDVAPDDDRNIGRLVVLGVVAAALVTFIAQNTQRVQINFLAWDRRLPLFLMLVLTVAVTLAITVLTSWFLKRRSRKKQSA